MDERDKLGLIVLVVLVVVVGGLFAMICLTPGGLILEYEDECRMACDDEGYSYWSSSESSGECWCEDSEGNLHRVYFP